MRKDASAHNRAYKFAQELEAWAKDTVHKDFQLTKINLDWNPKRTSSRGGMYPSGPGINIAMALAYPDNREETYRFYEYRSYDADSTIGGFYSKNPNDKLRAVICHEVAHALQYFQYSVTRIKCKPHGPVFKHYYKALRTEFINDTLPDQKLLAEEYKDYTRKLELGVQYVISSLLASSK